MLTPFSKYHVNLLQATYDNVVFAGKILKDLFAFIVVLYFAGSRQKLKSYHSGTSAGNVLLVSMFWSCFGVKFEAPCFQMYLSIPTVEPYNYGLTHKMTRKTSTKNTT